MHWLFRSVTDRLKALFAADLALEFEAELFARQAQRQALLLRQADAYAAEGLETLAAELRARAEGLSLEHPLAGVRPAIGELQADPAEGAALALLPRDAPPPRPNGQGAVPPARATRPRRPRTAARPK
jgi:hypothetical protein